VAMSTIGVVGVAMPIIRVIDVEMLLSGVIGVTMLIIRVWSGNANY
jgi:hypothetical protein